MSTSTSVFPFAHIALTAAITACIALLVLVVLRTRFKVYSAFRLPAGRSGRRPRGASCGERQAIPAR